MTTTTTCVVCGATEEPARDHTCPVCGADLPAGEAAAPEAAAPEATEADEVNAPTGTSEPAPAAPPVPSPVPPPPPGGGAGRPSFHDPSHPSGLSSSLRTYGMLTHLSAFAGAIVALAFVGPLIMWLARRDEHPFLDHHGKEALNFNLSMLLYGVIGFVASFATLGIGLIVVIPAAVVFFVTWVVTTIVAAVKANNGEGYRYPLTIRFIGEDA